MYTTGDKVVLHESMTQELVGGAYFDDKGMPRLINATVIKQDGNHYRVNAEVIVGWFGKHPQVGMICDIREELITGFAVEQENKSSEQNEVQQPQFWE